MSEIQQTPEMVLGTTIGSEIVKGLTPHFEQNNALLQSVLKNQEEHLVMKSANQLSEEQLQEKIQPLQQQIADLKAVQEEQLIKKSANVSVGTAFEVQDFDKFQFNTQKAVLKQLSGKADALETQSCIDQCIEYTKSFASKNPHIDGFESEMYYKSATPASDVNMSALFNAPFVLPLVSYHNNQQVMGRVATNRVSNSKKVKQPIVTGDIKTQWIGLVESQNEKSAPPIFSYEEVSAAGVKAFLEIHSELRDEASENLPNIISEMQTFLRNALVDQFETAYATQGITLGKLGGSIEGIIPDDVNQYAYNLNSKIGSDQYELGKLAYIKSGVASQVTYDTAAFMVNTLPQGTRFQIMANSTTIFKFQNLKDTANNPIFFNGNGGAIANGLPSNILGAELIVNNKMPADIAVYGDITGSYCITTCFGGYRVFERPAVENKLNDGLLGKMYATGKITNYRNIRLYKLAA